MLDTVVLDATERLRKLKSKIGQKKEKKVLNYFLF